MKKHLPCLLASLLLFAGPGCSSKKADPAPPAKPPTAINADFEPTTGTFTIQPKNAASYRLSGLKLKIEAVELSGSTNISYNYTWRGLTPAGTGIEVRSAFVRGLNAPIGPGPWNVDVSTYTTDAAFGAPVPLDLTGRGVLTSVGTTYSLTYTAQVVSGTLVP